MSFNDLLITCTHITLTDPNLHIRLLLLNISMANYLSIDYTNP